MLASADQFQGCDMEQIWTIRGAYANWKLTVTADAPDDEPEPNVSQLPRSHFTSVADHFTDAVNYYECIRDKDEVYGVQRSEG